MNIPLQRRDEWDERGKRERVLKILILSAVLEIVAILVACILIFLRL
jgi:hypothetical protein